MKPVSYIKIAVREGESVMGHCKGLMAVGTGFVRCFLLLMVNVSWVFGENFNSFLNSLRCFQRVLVEAVSRLRTAGGMLTTRIRCENLLCS